MEKFMENSWFLWWCIFLISLILKYLDRLLQLKFSIPSSSSILFTILWCMYIWQKYTYYKKNAMPRSLRWRTILSYVLIDTTWTLLIIWYSISFWLIDKSKYIAITLHYWWVFAGTYLLSVWVIILLGLLFLSLWWKIALHRLGKNSIKI
jgi:hypothetical protein